MEITYIGHSGFLMEWDHCYWLFDYYKGVIPDLDSNKKIFVFASHKHGDHFNPEIFRLSHKYSKVEYVLSSDIYRKSEELEKFNVTKDMLGQIKTIKPYEELDLLDEENHQVHVKALKSTDCGVAFLLQYQGKTIYHAGDLNLWVWKEETKQYNNNMTAMFQKEMNILKDVSIDIAFAPLDPRQEEWYYLGLDELVKTAKVRYVFPMHFWDKPEIILQYKQERNEFTHNTKVMEINQEGQKWEID